MRTQSILIIRHGNLTDVFWTCSFNPADDEASAHGVDGVLVVRTDTVTQVLAEQRQTLFVKLTLTDSLHSLDDLQQIERTAMVPSPSFSS